MNHHPVPNGVYLAPDVIRLDPSFGPKPRRRHRRPRVIFAPPPPWPLRVLAAALAYLRRFLP